MVGKVNMLLEDTDDWPRIVANQGQDKTLGSCKLEDMAMVACKPQYGGGGRGAV